MREDGWPQPPRGAQHRDVAQWPEELLSTGCSVWPGCPRDAFISRESSLALLVQEFVFFFFPPVTKSWKTPLNNISKHSWNKDRAQGESGNRPRDNQSCCCSLTSPTGGPDSPGEAHSGPSSFPHAGALSVPAAGQGLGSEGSRLAQTDCQEHSQGKGWREARS